MSVTQRQHRSVHRRRPFVAVSAALSALPAVGCSGNELGSGEAARSAAVAAPELSEDGRRWVMTVALTAQAVGRAEIVQIAFDVDDMQCQDGGEVDPTSIEPGAPVSFRRVGDGIDAMSPPIISAEDVVINCP